MLKMKRKKERKKIIHLYKTRFFLQHDFFNFFQDYFDLYKKAKLLSNYKVTS